MSIAKAVELVGGQAEMARLIGVSPQAITKWLRRKKAPPERCIAIEEATAGAVTRYELNSDVFGRAPSEQPKRKAA